jgi:hypothetical protein
MKGLSVAGGPGINTAVNDYTHKLKFGFQPFFKINTM